MSECFEVLVAHFECPGGRSDRLRDIRASPHVGISRITSVTSNDGRLEFGIAQEVLATEPYEVLLGRPQIGAAQVDDPQDTVIVEPVARLPVPMSGDDRCTPNWPASDLLTHLLCNPGMDAVRHGEETQGPVAQASIPRGVSRGVLVVENGAQPTACS